MHVDPEQYVKSKYSVTDEGGALLSERTLNLWYRFERKGLATKDFINAFCEGGDDQFIERYTEMLLADILGESRLKPSFGGSKKNGGPDFKVETNETTMWFEATAPNLGDAIDRLPEGYTDPIGVIRRERNQNPDYVHSVSGEPEEILQRWTNAINEKWKKYKNYVNKEIVGKNDVYVICVNACNLGYFGRLHRGGNDYNMMLSSVFPVGEWQVRFPKNHHIEATFERPNRPVIIKANGSDIATDIFTLKNYEGISAILATDESPMVWNASKPVAEFGLVHNPLAKNPLPRQLLNLDKEFMMFEETDHCVLRSL